MWKRIRTRNEIYARRKRIMLALLTVLFILTMADVAVLLAR